MSQLNSLKSISSLWIFIPEEARSSFLYTAVEGLTSLGWCRLLQILENLVSLVVPLPFALLPVQVVILSSSNFTTMCPRSRRVSIVMDIPADEVYDEQLRRITKFAEVKHGAGFTLSSLVFQQ